MIIAISEDSLTEKAMKLGLPRLHSSSVYRSSLIVSRPPSTSNGLRQKSSLDFNPNVTINANANANAVNSVSGFIKLKGLNIMDRIGESDHSGWMRKRDDRKSSWKNRYLILKGPHLYILKSNNKSVSCALLGFSLNIEFLCRKVESKDIFLLLDIRLRLMRVLILDDTVSGLIVIMTSRITSARRRELLFGIG